MSSIKISQLNEQVNLTSQDFFPYVYSSSLTTYRTDLNTLQTFLGIPEISMSWSSQSLSSSAVLSASYPVYPQISCSWTSQSISSSYTITSSYAPFPNQIYQVTCSWVSQSISSSYALSASWALQPPQYSCLESSSSTSGSYALSASWAPGGESPSQYSLVPSYITPINIILNSSLDSDYFKYTIPNPNNIINGIIIQGSSNVLESGGEQYGVIYVSSSLTPYIPLTSLTHGYFVNTIFLAVPSTNPNIVISASVVVGTTQSPYSIDYWTISLIGYY